MKSRPYIILGILLGGTLASCQSISTSFYSISYPSYENSNFDFDYVFDNKRKLAEYEVHREYLSGSQEEFSGPLLNPANYPEDDTMDTFYHPTGSYEPEDLSEEVIEFLPYREDLAELINEFPNGAITDPLDLETLIDNAGSNDSIITQQETDYAETILYHDYENGPYYAFNNYHKEETLTLTRHPNQIVNGTGNGLLYYQDGFDETYAVKEQIRANGYNIYEMRDETYSAGSTAASDYKITTPRVLDNFMYALFLGGGLTAARFLTETVSLYTDLTTPTSENYNQNYAYELVGMKTDTDLSITLTTHVEPHLSATDEEVYGLDLIYEFVISEGVVTDQFAHQTYWTYLTA